MCERRKRTEVSLASDERCLSLSPHSVSGKRVCLNWEKEGNLLKEPITTDLGDYQQFNCESSVERDKRERTYPSNLSPLVTHSNRVLSRSCSVDMYY